RTGDRNEGTERGGWQGVVDRPRDVLAAATGRADDERPRARLRGDLDLLADSANRVALADELARVIPLAQLAAQLRQQRMQALGSSGGRDRCSRWLRDNQEQKLVALGLKRQPNEPRRPRPVRLALVHERADRAGIELAEERLRRRAESR